MLQDELGTLPRFQEELIPAQPVPVPLQGQGALVVEVLPGTPAKSVQLQVGDLIVAIDRTPVDNDHPLPAIMSLYEPGDRVTIQFSRAGQRQRVQVRLAEHPDIPGQAYLGIRFETISGPGNWLPQD
jgi:S1-C subfamily serine protease